MAYLQDKLQEDIQYIHNIEVFNEEDLNTWVGQAYINTYILKGMCRSASEKVKVLSFIYFWHFSNVKH